MPLLIDEKKLGEKIGESVIKELFEILEESDVGKNKIKKLTDNVIAALGKIGKINPEAVNSFLDTIGKVDSKAISAALKTFSKLDPKLANATLKNVNQILDGVKIDDINQLINNVSSAANSINESKPLIQNALKAVSYTPFVLGVNCLLSLGNLITGALTVKELKNIKIELQAIKGELIIVNQKLGSMLEKLDEQNAKLEKIDGRLEQTNYLVGYKGREDNKINDTNIKKIKSRYQNEDYKESIHYSNECLEFRESRVFYYRGLSLYELGYYFAAIENFTKAIEQDPNNSKYLYWRGLSFLHLSFMEAAKHDFEELLLVKQESPPLSAHLDLAKKNYASAQGKYLEIIDRIDIIERIKPEVKKYELYYFLGICCLVREEHENANNAFLWAQHLAVQENKKNRNKTISTNLSRRAATHFR